MSDILIVLGITALTIQAFIGLSFFVSCIWEKEKRASFFAGLQFLGMLLLLVGFILVARMHIIRTNFGIFSLLLAYCSAAILAYLLIRRTEPNHLALKGTEGYIRGDVKRFDERLQVFARNRSLPLGSEQYERFYSEHPELEAFDAERREKGGPIGRPGLIDRPNERPNIAATMALRSIPLYLSSPEIVEPRAVQELKDLEVNLSPEEATLRIKGFAESIGADLVGIAKINPLWIYSHRGEIFDLHWDAWGKEITLDHQYAVVFAEEMALGTLGSAPHTPATLESMINYAKGAYIATQVAAFIANLGHKASANHLRHYTTILPPLAVDAGLGEIGRLGYLMTKEFGPRVRLSAVTTNLPLTPDKPVDIGVEDFCRFCKKCAVCCPSNAISIDEDPKESNGSIRWKLDAEACFGYWGKVGTDCSICMRVCPWSHARTFPHRLIVWLITRNKYSRRIFSIMDDIFYGRKPKPKLPPKWADFR